LSGGWTALVLAASGADDPLARAEGAPRRGLIDLAGRPLLQRALDALEAVPSVGRVVVAADDARLLAALAPRPQAAQPGETALDTVRAAFAQLGPPLLVVGDRALPSPELIEEFLAGALLSRAAAAIGVVPESSVQAGYPEVERAYLRFAEDGYAATHLFALLGGEADRALAFCAEIDWSARQPWALIRAIDPWTLGRFVARRLTLAQAVDRLGRRLKLPLAAVPLFAPEAAFELETPQGLALARRLYASRALAPPSQGRMKE